MDVAGFLKSLDVNSTAHTAFISNILLWKQWYQGEVSNFHNYTIYNGVKDVKMHRYTLNIPKFLCEKMADLLFNEKVHIRLGNDKNTKILNDILDQNNFQLLMNRAIEKSFALGTGCILLDIDNILINSNSYNYDNSKIKISFVEAENIYPLSWDNGEIKELAIIRYEKIKTGEYKCIITLHLLNELGNYVIRNYQFVTDLNRNIKGEFDKDNYISEFDTRSNVKWFSIITPNIINNIDMYSPFGISIFANSIDVIKGIDIVYDSFVNEIKLGRKRLFTTKEVLRFNAVTGQNEFNFDPNDIVFHVLGDGFSDGDGAKNYIQEINGALRITDHINALDSDLRILGAKTGFGTDYFTFDKKTIAPKTATEVISENNELFRTIKKHELMLEKVIKDIIYAIKYIGSLRNKFSLNTNNITIDFDDSIIENKAEEREQDRKDLAQDTLSRKDYIIKWYGVDELVAEEKIREIDREVPANEKIHFVDGEIN